MSAYYNDFEPAACAWLSELMAAEFIRAFDEACSTERLRLMSGLTGDVFE